MAPKINGLGVMPEDTRICVVMVGLPARGKSYIAQRGEVALGLQLAIHPDLD
jgi:6-phosphofructo-2-kinase/fructose-2,6-biphosphatase 2